VSNVFKAICKAEFHYKYTLESLLFESAYIR